MNKPAQPHRKPIPASDEEGKSTVNPMQGGHMAHIQQTGKKSEWNRTSIILAFAACVVVGLLIFFGIRLFTQQADTGNAAAGRAPGSNTGGAVVQQGGGQATPPAGKGSGYPASFLNTVEQHIVQGLHLTVDRVTSEVSSGKQIADVAAAQGISRNQLHTIELNAYQAAFNQAVQNGTYTLDQANTYMENYRQRDPAKLNGTVTALFGGSSGTPQARG
jgi:hypothetical protein